MNYKRVPKGSLKTGCMCIKCNVYERDIYTMYYPVNETTGKVPLLPKFKGIRPWNIICESCKVQSEKAV